jgi:hypothetical protein
VAGGYEGHGPGDGGAKRGDGLYDIDYRAAAADANVRGVWGEVVGDSAVGGIAFGALDGSEGDGWSGRVRWQKGIGHCCCGLPFFGMPVEGEGLSLVLWRLGIPIFQRADSV